MNELLKGIKKLNVGEYISFEYRLRDYEIKCYRQSLLGGKEKTYAVKQIDGIKSIELMNVDKITNKYISLYSYNMMSQQCKYKMDISKITITKK